MFNIEGMLNVNTPGTYKGDGRLKQSISGSRVDGAETFRNKNLWWTRMAIRYSKVLGVNVQWYPISKSRNETQGAEHCIYDDHQDGLAGHCHCNYVPTITEEYLYVRNRTIY